MSVEQARGLLQKVAEDEEFRARLDSAPHDQKRSILAEAGFGDVKLRDISMALPESAGGELSDEEMEQVAGGLSDTAVGTIAGGASAVSGAAITIITIAVVAA